MTKTITLHCPSRDLTIPTFVITPFQKQDQILKGIRLTLDIPFASLYTIDAKHIADPHNVQDGQRILVAASKDEEVLPDAPRGWEVYLGEEGADELEWEVRLLFITFSRVSSALRKTRQVQQRVSMTEIF